MLKYTCNGDDIMGSVAIYARVSTAQQAEKGYSLGTQISACRKYATDAGLMEITEFIDDGFSGEYIERPALSRMRVALQQRCFVTVIVYDPDRLARNLVHQLLLTEEIESCGASLRFVSVQFEESPEGSLFYSIRGAVAAYEKEKIKERSIRGKRGKALQGKIIFDAKPYGYHYDRLAAMYTVNDIEAAVVRLMFDRLLNAGFGTVRIAQELTGMGIPTPRSRPAWNGSTVYRIITNPLYAGIFYSMKYRYQKVSQRKRVRFLRPVSEWILIIAPSIVEQAVWAAAQEQLRHNRTTALRNNRWRHLLSGLVYCARCGRRLKAVISGNQSLPYYACPGRPVCDARRIPAVLLDKVVWEELFTLFNQESLMKAVCADCNWNAAGQLAEMAIQQLIASQTELLRRRKMVSEWFSHQNVSAEEAVDMLQAVRCELETVTERLTAAQDRVAAQNASRQSDMSDVVWEKWTVTQFAAPTQSAALQAVLTKVAVERLDNTQRKNSRPDLAVCLLFR